MAPRSNTQTFAATYAQPIAACVLAIAIFSIDVFTPLEGAIAVLYVVVVLLASSYLERRGIVMLGLICMALTIGGHLASHGLEVNASVVRFLVSLATIAITTFLAARVRQQQDALRRSEAYLAEAQRLSLTGSFGWTPGSGEIFWSEQTYRIFDYDPSARPTVALIEQRVHPEDRHVLRYMEAEAAKGTSAIDVVHRLVMPDGSTKHIHVLARAVVSPHSAALEYVGAVSDITAAKRADEALHEAQVELAHVTRMTTLGQLTASIAHEVNQPLTGVVMNGAACLRWLGRDPPELDEVRVSVETMISDAQRASEVIAKIRALARRSNPDQAPLDVNDIVNDVVRLVQRELLGQRVTLGLDLAPALPPVIGDRVQLQQVVINLVINGIQAMAAVMERSRRLTIRSGLNDGGDVLVEVEDSGGGFDEATAQRLFDAFFTTKTDGMGMGLSICRSIIEAHGGRVSASSAAGQGATFRIVLPGSQAAAA